MTDAKRKVRILTFRGKELEELCEMKDDNLVELYTSRMKRKLRRCNGFRGPYLKLLEKIKASKVGIQPGERAPTIKTHLRNCIVMPQMVGGNVAVYNGKEYKEVEIKFDMIGRYLGEYSLTYKPTLRKAPIGKKEKKADKKK
jgi:small subunit ribosomal protein S15e